jgi:hypothetical protein
LKNKGCPGIASRTALFAEYRIHKHLRVFKLVKLFEVPQLENRLFLDLPDTLMGDPQDPMVS